ncbi:hypothetical protein D6D13_00576 [Aureobasidium pullulans]|uniref:Rhodopsin domain-containing protein n=1 Tax=Aureobasidium pullulans TaxID=5580 RepID=A0A4S9DFW0_AURPU|nr:hypothetical protein D6D13_00576 [Aureobasidium pullulans]
MRLPWTSNWSLEEGACSTFNSLRVLQIDWALNFTSDIAIFVLPFPLLRHLHLGSRQIYGLLVTFALGLATIAVNLARFITIQTGNNWNAVFIWSMAEMAVAIIVVSLPALKTLLRRKNQTSTSSNSCSNGHHYALNSSHRRSVFGRSDPMDDMGSDVELNRVGKRDVIYKTKEVSVDSRPIDEGEDGGPLAQAWTNSGYGFQAGKGVAKHNKDHIYPHEAAVDTDIEVEVSCSEPYRTLQSGRHRDEVSRLRSPPKISKF